MYFLIKISFSIHFLVLFATMTFAQKASVPSKETAPTPKKIDEVQTCRNLFEKFGKPYKSLWEKRSPDLRDEHTEGLSRIAEMSVEHCAETETRKDFTEVLTALLNGHSGRIAILLPLSTKIYTRHLQKGVEAAALANGVSKDKLIFMDTSSRVQRTEQLIAQAIFQHKVTAILGGYEVADLELLKSFASQLLVPTFILNKPPANHKAIPFVYFVHPTPKRIAESLITANQKYRHKNISIMRPNDQHSDDVVREYEALAKTSGISVLHSVTYDAKRIDQMESAARKLFKLEPNDRLDELKQLYTKGKEFAAKRKIPFNPKMIALQPVITQDAIMILDQFKNVRHMARVFSFLGLRRIPLFGHFEWRSSGLIDPYDPMFQGSYFTDVVGTYSTLPAGLQIPSLVSNTLATPDKVEEIDLSSLAYRAVLPIFPLIKRSELPRRKFETIIPRLDQSSGLNIQFDSDNVLYWPTYLFEVVSQGKSGSIVLKSP